MKIEKYAKNFRNRKKIDKKLETFFVKLLQSDVSFNLPKCRFLSLTLRFFFLYYSFVIEQRYFDGIEWDYLSNRSFNRFWLYYVAFKVLLGLYNMFSDFRVLIISVVVINNIIQQKILNQQENVIKNFFHPA